MEKGLVKPKPKTKLKDVAKATGFSENTVSLALRGSPRLPESTRDLILRAAEELNYFPNHIARSLANNATRTIGLVLTDIMNPTLTLAARTIERELTKAGYGMMFAASDTNVESEKRALLRFQSYQVDGILVYPAHHRKFDHIVAVAEAGTPVLLLAELRGSGLDTVAIDDMAGAYKVACHLLGLGHRRIAMLDGGFMSGNDDKRRGIRNAIRQAGLPANTLIVHNTKGTSATQGYRVMPAVMADPNKPTALVASTDALATGALRWCGENGISVPGQMAIAGYDNTEVSEFSVLPLTTVNYAADEISRIGVARILHRLENKEARLPAETQLIEPELIVRATT